jgi:ribosomal protein S18 acetylase RimI-like enzyme
VAGLLHDDFREFGASGQVRDRNSVAKALAAEPGDGGEAHDVDAVRLADDVVLLTYELRTPARPALRSSVWVRDGGTWRIRFHQGTPSPSRSPVYVRRGTQIDAPVLTEMMFIDPSREAIVMAGDAVRAARFQLTLLRRTLASPDGAVFVVERDRVPIGFAEVTRGGDVPPVGVIVRTALDAFGILGSVRAAWKSRARARVDMKALPDCVHLVELQVHPDERDQGAGGALLRAVEAEARARGVGNVSLTTAIDNPARRLYERHGFAVVAERRDARYERLTGSPGRVLMVKPLAVTSR